MFIGLVLEGGIGLLVMAVLLLCLIVWSGNRRKLRADALARGEKDPAAINPFVVALVFVFMAMFVAGMILNAQAGR